MFWPTFSLSIFNSRGLGFVATGSSHWAASAVVVVAVKVRDPVAVGPPSVVGAAAAVVVVAVVDLLDAGPADAVGVDDDTDVDVDAEAVNNGTINTILLASVITLDIETVLIIVVVTFCGNFSLHRSFAVTSSRS